jgi:hypothetical protein
MVGGGHGLPKVSLSPTMPTFLCPAGWPQDGCPAAFFYRFGHHAPYAYDVAGHLVMPAESQTQGADGDLGDVGAVCAIHLDLHKLNDYA